MESQGDDDPMNSDISPFHSSQDSSSVYSTLQMLTSTQPSPGEGLSGMVSQFIPAVSVSQAITSDSMTSDVMSHSQSLTGPAPSELCEDTILFRCYMPQFQNLTSLQPLHSALVMTSQDSSMTASNAPLMTSSETTQPPTVSSPQLTTLNPAQFMLVSSTQLLPMASSSQVTLTTSHLTMTSPSSTVTSSSDLLTCTTPQLTTMISQATSSLQTIPSLTDLPLVPSVIDGVSNQEAVTSSQLDSLVLPAANPQNLLDVATPVIREHSQDLPNQVDAGATDFETCWEESLKEATQSPVLDASGEYDESFTDEWSRLFKEKFSPYFGYVHTLEEAEELLHVYEMCTESQYVGIKRCDKTNFEIDASKGRPFRYTPLTICGQKVPFDCVPYYHGGKAMYYCHLGSKRKEPPKDRPLKNPDKRKESKKVGCAARIAFRVVARFPEHKLKCDTEHHRLVASQTLSKVWKEGRGKDVAVEWRVYVMLPKASDHTNHELVRTSRLRDRPLDRRLIGRICQLVQMGLTNTHSIQKHVVHFAEHVLKKEGMSWKNRRDICGSRQVWWYRKQMLDLMESNTLESSKFLEMIRDVEDIAQKHNYNGFIYESPESEDDAVGGKWKKRTELKNRKSYEKQLSNLKGECFMEFQHFIKNVESCSQVEVLARTLNSIKTFRKTFEKELQCEEKKPKEPKQNVFSDQIIQILTVDSTQLMQIQTSDMKSDVTK